MTTSPTTIFFSWQADTATTEGRYLIEHALERAVGRLGATVEEPERSFKIDKDTKDVPGSPPVVDIIFKKIDQAAVFVPDLTFVGKRLDGRPMPNPNVMIEYGWALKTLAHHRIVPVMNVAYGEPNADNMPFDLQHLRYPAVTYRCPDGATDAERKSARDELAKRLEEELQKVLKSKEYKESLSNATPAPKFVPRASAGSLGRYRPANEPLGVVHDRVAIMLGKPASPIYLDEGPVLWLRVLPDASQERQWLVTDIEAIGSGPAISVGPLGDWRGIGHMRAEDGWGKYAHTSNDRTPSAVMIFTSGEIWAVDTYVLSIEHRGERVVFPLENVLNPALESYAITLEKLGVKPPFRWIAGVEDIGGRMLALNGHTRGPALGKSIVAEGRFSPGDLGRKVLRPFSEKFYDAFGVGVPSEPK
jgi:hypothetical protein